MRVAAERRDQAENGENVHVANLRKSAALVSRRETA
jgi:hypothetical protein